MINIQDLKDYHQCLKNRGDDVRLLDKVLEKYQERKDKLLEVETQKAEKNRTSKEIAIKRKKGEDTSEMVLAMRNLGDKIQKMQQELNKIEQDYHKSISFFAK